MVVEYVLLMRRTLLSSVTAPTRKVTHQPQNVLCIYLTFGDSEWVSVSFSEVTGSAEVIQVFLVNLQLLSWISSKTMMDVFIEEGKRYGSTCINTEGSHG